MNKRIYLCLAHMSGKEQMYIKEAFDTNWVVPLGPNVNGFEKDLEEFVGEDKHVVALSAGTAAVHLALLACGVKPGDEVLVQSFTFCASSHPITYLGATPVFVDSEVDTWNMDPALLEEAIKDRIEKTGKNRKRLSRWPYMGCLIRWMRLWLSLIGMGFRSLRMRRRVLALVMMDVCWVRLENMGCCRSMGIR